METYKQETFGPLSRMTFLLEPYHLQRHVLPYRKYHLIHMEFSVPVVAAPTTIPALPFQVPDDL